MFSMEELDAFLCVKLNKVEYLYQIHKTKLICNLLLKKRNILISMNNSNSKKAGKVWFAKPMEEIEKINIKTMLL